jgi:chemotaxis family two-component system response regulator Rcp1
MEDRSIQILLVEDNPVDVRLTISGLRDARILNQVSVVEDGEQALQFLRREGQYAGAPRPDVVFLDLNIPRVDGHEVLRAMKSDDSLKRIPVVVVSGSDRVQDVNKAYDEQVCAYIVKPTDPDEYFSAIRKIKDLWFRVVTLPRAEKAGTSS